jgi:U4/U6.U5 tri-snRNP-associated protein 1
MGRSRSPIRDSGTRSRRSDRRSRSKERTSRSDRHHRDRSRSRDKRSYRDNGDRTSSRKRSRSKDRHHTSSSRHERRSRRSRSPKTSNKKRKRVEIEFHDDAEDDGSSTNNPRDNHIKKKEMKVAEEVEEAIPTAQVTNSGNEISCTVEETNRIRALLGLKPLKVDKDDKDDKETAGAKLAKDNAKKLIEERISKARKQRELHEKLKGETLGGGDDSEDEDDLLAWVKKSRNDEQKRRAKEEESDEYEDEEEEDLADKYTSKDLTGLKVTHDMSSFIEGEQVVLTLKDTDVLAEEDEDVLENATLATNDRYKELNQIKKKSKLPVYSAIDDDEFDSNTPKDRKTRLLSQYNEDIKSGPALTIGKDGAVDTDKILAAEKVRERLRAAESGLKGVAENLQANSMIGNPSSEYFTEEEMVKFQKPKRRKKKKKKRTSALQELENIAKETSSGATVKSTRDRGSRGSKSNSMKDKETEQSEARAKSYDNAVAAAYKKQSKLSMVNEEEEDEDDAQLQKALERARRMKSMQNTGGEVSSTSLSIVQSSIDKRRKDEEERKRLVELELTGGVHTSTDGVVFSSAIEFSKRLQANVDESKKEAARVESLAAAARESGASFVNGEQESKGDDMEIETDTTAGGDASAQTSFTMEQPIAATGMAATLALLSQKGDLKKDVVQFKGRSKDERLHNSHGSTGEVRIEHRDEFGNLLTPKEAFRQMCYTFHGITPSTKSREKRLKKLAMENEALGGKKSKNSVTKTAFDRNQAKTGQAHMIISGKQKKR